MPPPPPPPAPSALTTLTSTTTNLPTPQSATTTQILHNLRHQHLWTSLETHLLPADKPGNPTYLISGIPPHRVYTHPEEQLYLLEKGLREDDLPAERIFVIPTAQGQTWSLGRMAGVFDSADEGNEGVELGLEGEKAEGLKAYYARRKTARETREWGGKRMLLAMVDKGMGGDGTVVYYVVQEGAVKPRQN